MNITPDIRIILDAMRRKGWTKQQCCRFCHVDGGTLNTILSGGIPKRLDALYRLLNGLGLSAEQALIRTRRDNEGRRLHAVG